MELSEEALAIHNKLDEVIAKQEKAMGEAKKTKKSE